MTLVFWGQNVYPNENIKLFIPKKGRKNSNAASLAALPKNLKLNKHLGKNRERKKGEWEKRRKKNKQEEVIKPKQLCEK